MTKYKARYEKKPYNTDEEDGGLFDLPDGARDIHTWYEDTHAIVRWLEPVEETETVYRVKNMTGDHMVPGRHETKNRAIRTKKYLEAGTGNYGVYEVVEMER